MQDAREQVRQMKLKKYWLKYINREIRKAEKLERKAKQLQDEAKICKQVAHDMAIEYKRKFEMVEE